MKDYLVQDFVPELKTIWHALVRQDTLPGHVDAIVVGGCRDFGLAEKTAELYHAGVSRKIIVTGYQPNYMNITEAQLLANRCEELDIPKECIVLESNAKNTGENIRLSAILAEEAQSIILIHKPYMSLRFFATAEAQWPSPQPRLYSACQEITFEDYCAIHGIEKVACTMLGEMKRLDDYVVLGYQTYQVIPDEARKAFNTLVDNGVNIR